MERSESEAEKLKGKHVKFFLRSNNYKFEGKCLGIENNFLIFVDSKTKLKSMRNLDDISELVEVQR